MPKWLDDWFTSLQSLAWYEILGYAVLAAIVVQFILIRLVLALTRRTKTNIDEKIVKAIRWPLFITLLLIGVGLTLRELIEYEPTRRVLRSVLWTVAIFLWMRGLLRASEAVLDVLARRVDDFKWIEPRSLPLYEILTKLLIVGAAIYGLMVAWNIDVTAWLASAGILAFAVGFAAKDTLANLFSGMFILADAPYKLGDYIVLGTGERGKVTDIGMRSTRILTRDDIEITIPNAVIANAKIVNETSGPSQKRRVRVDLGVAYGSDIEKVRSVLLEVAKDCDLLLADPAPSVRLRAFGDSAILVQLRVYIPEPVLRGRVVDRLLTDTYLRFQEEDIQIPFPQRVVHLEGQAATA